MKHLYKYLFLICITLFSFSCNNDEEKTKESEFGLPIRFSSEELNSRTSQEGTFEDGDAIGIFAYSPRTSSVYAVNKKYVYDGQYFLAATEEDEIWVTRSADIDFYVYYPYQQGQNNINSIVYSIKDQSTEQGWLASDFLTATYTDIVEDYTIQLDFFHRFSTIKVNINDNNKDKVVMKNIKSTAEFDLMAGTYTVKETKSDIGMYNIGNGSFLVTVPVQQISSDNKVEISRSGSESVELSTSRTITTEEGKIHNYVIDNQKTITINNWSTGGTVTGDGGYFLGSSCTVVASPKAGYEFEGWYENGKKVSSEPSMTFEVLKDRTFETKYISYGAWEITLNATPQNMSAFAGTSQITSSATADIYINGVNQNTTKKATPVVSIKTPVSGFSYDDEEKILSATLNTTEAPRSVVLVAQIGEQTKELTVTQNGEKFEYSDWEISITANPTRIKADGTQKSTITATAVRDVLLEGKIIEENVPDENLQLSGSASGFTFDTSTRIVSATNNTSTSERSIVITATTSKDTQSKSVTVTQEKGVMTYGEWSDWETESLIVTANPTDIEYSGGTSTINVIAKQTKERDIIWNGIKEDTDYEEQEEDVTNSATYTNNGLNGFTHNNDNIVSAGNNEGGNDRSITVTASFDGKTGNVTISQSGGVVTYGEWQITLSATPTTIIATGGSSNIKVSATRQKYVNGVAKEEVPGYPTLSGSASGFRLSGTTVTADENMVESSRSITVTATIGEGSEQKTKTVTVTQEPAVIETTWTIDLSASSSTIPAAGGESTITATASGVKTINGAHAESVSGTPSLSHSGSLSWNSGNKTLSAGNNNSTSTKSSTITATIGNATKKVTVTQDAGSKSYGSWEDVGTQSISVSVGTNSFSYNGGSTTITTIATIEERRSVKWNGIHDSYEYDTYTTDVSNLASYSEPNFASVTGRTLYVNSTSSESDRSGRLTASYDGETDYVTIYQSGVPVSWTYDYEISVSPGSGTIDEFGGSCSYTVSATKITYRNGAEYDRTSTSASVKSKPSWITSASTSSCSAGENNTGSLRSGTIVFQVNENPSTTTSFSVVQDRLYNVGGN